MSAEAYQRLVYKRKQNILSQLSQKAKARTQIKMRSKELRNNIKIGLTKEDIETMINDVNLMINKLENIMRSNYR